MTDAPSSEPQPAAPGARCAIHPERTALTVCRRCGNYMCQACTSGGHFAHCPGCRGRLGVASFPFSRDRWTFDGLVSHCFATWRDHAVTLGLATFIFFALVMGLGFVIGFLEALLDLDEATGLAVSVAGQVVQTVLQVGLQIGLFTLCFEAVEGRAPDLGNLLLGFRKLPAALLQLVLVYAAGAVLVGSVVGAAWIFTGDLLSTDALWIYAGAFAVLFLPGVYVGLGLAFSMFELAHNPRATGLGAMGTSWRTVRGHRGSVLGVAVVSGIFSVLGLIACCLGLLVTYPLGLMLMCALYVTLQNPGAPPAPPAPSAPAPDPDTWTDTAAQAEGGPDE